MPSPISSQLDNLRKSTAVLDANVKPDGKIGSLEFLAAVDSLLAVYDTIRSDVLEGGRNDSADNVVKIRNLLQTPSGNSQTLQDFIGSERATGGHEATEALLWLTRGLEFYVASVKRFTSKSSEKLSDSISNAYKDTLKKHHGFVAKMAIKVAVSKTCPTREELFNQLGRDPSVIEDVLQATAAAFERVLDILVPFLDRDGIKF